MGGAPPPKEGEVTVSSTWLRELKNALLHGDTKTQWEAAKDIREKLDNAGY